MEMEYIPLPMKKERLVSFELVGAVLVIVLVVAPIIGAVIFFSI